MSTFLDTSIVIALLNHQDSHHAWSVQEFNRRKTMGPAIICDIVYCELSIAMDSVAHTDVAINTLGLERLSYSNEALFRAGQAFKTYKQKNKGQKSGVLPDFLVGALAEVEHLPLMTANPEDFKTYFPRVPMINP